MNLVVKMLLVKDFQDYEIMAMSNGEKLEKWGKYYLLRPDPQIIWQEDLNPYQNKIDAIYYRSKTGGGSWQIKRQLPAAWEVAYQDLKFNVKLMGFKHTGVFPEQSINWDFMRDKIKKANRPVKVLNLFAYTGCASVACLKEGASVVHVDSSKGMVDWAKENVRLNNLEKRPIRFIVDDVKKFVAREIRRGNKYDAIVMDPPTFGRGTKKEVWDIEKDLYPLILDCLKILNDQVLFFIINSYTSGLSGTVLENILKKAFAGRPGKIYSDELGIKGKDGLILPCGIVGRYEE